MTPKKRTTRSSPAITTTTTLMTNDQLKALIAQRVADVLVERTGIRRTERAAREGTYSDFLKCQPLDFKGSEGVVGLIVVTVTDEVAYAMTWKTLKKMMTGKYCPRGEIKKIEIEMWNLKVKESDMIKKYVGGLPDMIHRSVMASKPKTMQDAIEFATEQMDKKISTLAECQNVAQAYAARTGARKEYARTLSLCNKCKFHHNGPCTAKCANCKKVCHLTRDCWNPTATRNQRTVTCYECMNQGHYMSGCPGLKNQNHRNQAEGTQARGIVYALGGGETNQDFDDMEDDINAYTKSL
nr:hypothetical protein [Tanacetum cinerariifolium]